MLTVTGTTQRTGTTMWVFVASGHIYGCVARALSFTEDRGVHCISPGLIPALALLPTKTKTSLPGLVALCERPG